MFYKNLISRIIIAVAILMAMVMDSSSQWDTLGGPQIAKNARDLSAGYKNDTLTIYLADEIVLSKSTDRGSNWFPPDTTMKLPLLVACSPTNSDTVLVAKGRDVYLSTNGGVSYLSDKPVIDVEPLRILYSRGNTRDAWVGIKYKADESSLKRSDNGGKRFWDIDFFRGQNGNPKTNVEDVWTVPNNPNVVWVAGSKPTSVPQRDSGTSGLWRSDNKGDSFTRIRPIKIHTGSSIRAYDGAICAVTTNPSGSEVFIGLGDGRVARRYLTDTIFLLIKDFKKRINRIRATEDKLFVASDEGLYVGTFNNLDNRKIEERILSLEINATNSNEIYAGTEEYVYISTDGGTSWSKKNPKTTTATLNAKKVFKTGEVLLAICEKGDQDVIYRRVGGVWSGIDMSFANKSFEVMNEGDGFYQTTSGRIYIFGKINKPKGCPFIAYSDNLGESWTRMDLLEGSGKIYGMIRWKDSLFAYGSKIKIGKNETNLIKNVGGTNWVVAKNIGAVSNKVYSFVAIDTMRALVGTSDGLYWTDNGGVSWGWHAQATNNLKHDVVSFVYSAPYAYLATPNRFYRWDFTSNAPLSRPGNYKQVVLHNDSLYILRVRSGDIRDTIFKISKTASIPWSRSDTILINRSASDIRRIFISDSIYQATDKGIFKRRIPGRGMVATKAPSSLPIIGGTNPNDIVWESGGVVILNGTPTIPRGSKLTIEPGVRVLMTPGSQLRVQGELNIEGIAGSKVLFMPESPSHRWGGIVIEKDATANIEHAEITGAITGIMCIRSELEVESTIVRDCLIGVGFYGNSGHRAVMSSSMISNNAWGVVTLVNSNPVLNNNDIVNCQKGILIDGSNPLLENNRIIDNSQVGVVIYGGGYCKFSDITRGIGGYNEIRGNAVMQILAVKGTAFLGYQGNTLLNSFGGGNIIYGDNPDTPLGAILEYSQLVNLRLQVSLSKSNTGSGFLVDRTSRVIEDPIDPNPDPQELLIEAYECRRNNLFYEAINRYQTILSEYPMVAQAHISLNELYETYQEMKDFGMTTLGDEIRYYLEMLWGHPNSEVVRSSLIYTAREYARDEDINTSLDKYQQALNQTLDADLMISALLSQIMLEGYELENIEGAENVYYRLLHDYPDDERTQLAQLHLQLMQRDHQDIYGLNKGGSFEVKMRDISKLREYEKELKPTSYALSQNYPNPFNPSTLIKYQLPKQSKVTMKIYNIYGQEVKTLVDEVKEAGYYEVVWNGDNHLGKPVASGVYFCKISAGEFNEVRKMLLLK